MTSFIVGALDGNKVTLQAYTYPNAYITSYNSWDTKS